VDFDAPTGGFFLWADLVDPVIDPARLLAAAAERGLQPTAGRNVAATGGSSWDHRLRLAYSPPPADRLRPAVDRLRPAVDRLLSAVAAAR
jgi:DNA-binding transcriptional MocR family regulator